jgi:hypothetical protein
MNRKYKYIIFSASVLLMSACSKEIPLTPGLDQFNVTAIATTIKIGDTAKFTINGNPDMISFYSGDLYNDYSFKDGRDISLGKAELSFSSFNPALAAGLPPEQLKPLSVQISTDFNGDYKSYDNIEKATWIDVTNKFTIAPPSSTVYVASGKVDITEYIVPGKPFYYAFKYVTKPIAVNGSARPWYIYNMELISSSLYENHLLGNLVTSQFMLVEKVPSVPSLSTYTTTRITLAGYKFGEPGDPDPGTETWAISKPFDLKTLDKGPDRPFILKGNEDSKVTSHYYVYSRKGEYKVCFIGTNANADGSQKKIVELTVNVVE